MTLICILYPRALDCLAVEKGYKHWHADLRSTDTPIEAGLGFICKLKGDIPFLGNNIDMQQSVSCLLNIVIYNQGETCWKDRRLRAS